MNVMTPLDEAKTLIREAASDQTKQPRMHPNGFIQLDLAEGVRLHIWAHDESLPRQATVNTVHDHIFEMKSHVLIGQMVNKTYRFEPYELGDHQIYRASYRAQADSVLEPTGIYGGLAVWHEQPVHAGQGYDFDAFEFHDTITHGFTATLMKKTRVFDGCVPRVICPRGQDPDNDFVRTDVHVDALWEHVGRVIEQLASC